MGFLRTMTDFLLGQLTNRLIWNKLGAVAWESVPLFHFIPTCSEFKPCDSQYFLARLREIVILMLKFDSQCCQATIPLFALWWRNKHVVKFDFFSTICFLFVLIKAEPVIFRETFILVSFISLWQFKCAIHDAITSPKIVFTSWVLRSLEMWLNIFMLCDNFFLNVFGRLFCCLFVCLSVFLVVSMLLHVM